MAKKYELNDNEVGKVLQALQVWASILFEAANDPELQKSAEDKKAAEDFAAQHAEVDALLDRLEAERE